MQEGGRALGRDLEWLCLFLIWEPVFPRRCDESCLSCEGSSRNCSRCKTGFTQLGTSCVTNHTCSNGEHGWVTAPEPPRGCPGQKRKEKKTQGPQSLGQPCGPSSR